MFFIEEHGETVATTDRLCHNSGMNKYKNGPVLAQHKPHQIDEAPCFYKSTVSGADGACVEVAFKMDDILVRDSKDQSGPVLRFTQREWSAFLEGVRLNEFG